MTRAECANLSDTLLQVNIDGRVHRLREDWSRGRPGKLPDIYDLALLRAEYELRLGESLGPISGVGLVRAESDAA